MANRLSLEGGRRDKPSVRPALGYGVSSGRHRCRPALKVVERESDIPISALDAARHCDPPAGNPRPQRTTRAADRVHLDAREDANLGPSSLMGLREPLARITSSLAATGFSAFWS